MNNPYLHTPRLILAPINLAILRALQQGPEAFFDTTSWMLPDRYTEFPEYRISLVLWPIVPLGGLCCGPQTTSYLYRTGRF